MTNIDRQAVGIGTVAPDQFVLEYRQDWNETVLVAGHHTSLLRPVVSAVSRTVRRFAR